MIKIKKLITLDSYRLKNLILTILFLSIIFFFQLFLRQKINLNLFFVFIVLFSINYLCFIFYLNQERERKYFPIYPLIIFYYLITFTAYYYFDQQEYYFIENKVMISVIITISLGLFFFSLGYFLPNLFYKDKEDTKIKNIDKYNSFIILGSYIILIFIHINNFKDYISLGFLNQLREPLTLLIVVILQLKYFEKKSLTLLFFNIFFIFILFFVELSSGSTVFPFLIILMVIAINYFKTKKLNLINLFLLCYSIFFFHGIKLEIRKLNWVDNNTVFLNNLTKNLTCHDLLNDKKLSELNKNEILSDLLNDKKVSELYKDKKLIKLLKNEKIKNLYEEKILYNPIEGKTIVTNLYDTYKVVKTSSLDEEKLINSKSLLYLHYRLFHSNITLQRTIDLTPNAVKFLNGLSYQSIIYKPIPRFIYKNKPREEWGNAYGKLYKILNAEDFSTSWNFPILSEFYSNFGFKGVIFGMLILGLLTKSLIFFTHSFNKSTLISSMGYIVIFNLFFQESNLSQSVGKMINQSSFFICLIFFILIINICIKKFKNEN